MDEVLMGERAPTILNRGISIDDLHDIAKELHSVIQITATPDDIYFSITEIKEKKDD